MKTYYGKNGIMLIAIFLFYNVMPVLLISQNLSTFLSSGWWIIFWVAYFGFNLFWIPIMINNKIELYEDYFIFHYGFGKERILIRDIIEIKKSRNLIASSANSTDRIHIITVEKNFFVSLKDNDGFIQEIKKRKI